MPLTLINPELIRKAQAVLAKREDAPLTMFARIKKMDDEQQVCFAEVYPPSVLDTHGEWMDAAGVQEMAHKFMSLPDLSRSIDTNHDNIPNGSYPVESYIAKAGDPDYSEGTWVLGIKVPDPAVWAKVKSGELNGYSFEAYVRKVPTVVVLSMQTDNLGETEVAEDASYGEHTHLFLAVLDADGRVIAGRTTSDANHSHEIKRGTATEMSAGHAHRYFIKG